MKKMIWLFGILASACFVMAVIASWAGADYVVNDDGSVNEVILIDPVQKISELQSGIDEDMKLITENESRIIYAQSELDRITGECREKIKDYRSDMESKQVALESLVSVQAESDQKKELLKQ
jgi:hypothetical protein